jgi:sugar transferase (PEP-CTERM/EpsH1 system associated)
VRVLFLTHRLPYPPNRGDRQRAFHILRTLSTTADVDVVSLVHDDEEEAYAQRLRELFPIRLHVRRTSVLANVARVATGLVGKVPLTHCLLDAPGMSATLREISEHHPPDVVLAYCSGMARFALEPPLDRVPLVLDFVDVDSAKWDALARSTRWPHNWVYRREARYLGRFESLAACRAATCVVINERERIALQGIAPEAQIKVIGAGVDVELLRPNQPAANNAHIIFCGVMNYTPNVEGVLWFAEEVWPLIIAQQPDARFLVVGSNPTNIVRKLTSTRAGIEVTGSVPDVREYLWKSAVSVAPLRISRGLQNKVLEALGAHLPVVITPQVCEGLPSAVRSGCRVGASAREFADQVLALLAQPPSARRAIAQSASLDSLGWHAQIEPLVSILADAARGRPTTAGS